MSYIFGFFYTLFSLLPVIYQTQNILISFIGIFILLIGLIPLFIKTIKFNYFDFEDDRNPVNNIISIFVIIVSGAISIFLLKGPFSIINSIFLVMIINIYYHFFSSEILGKKDFVLELWTKNIMILIVSKLCFIIYLYLRNGYINYPILWLFSGIADFILLIILQATARDFSLNSFKYILPPIVLSVFIHIKIEVFPYEYILRFFNWLLSLGSGIVIEPPPANTKEFALLDLIESSTIPKEDSVPRNYPDLTFLWNFLEKFIYVLILSGIIYFFIIPLIKPLLVKNRNKVTLSQYWGNIKSWIKEFFKKKELGVKSYLDIRTSGIENIKKEKTTRSLAGFLRVIGINLYYKQLKKWILSVTQLSSLKGYSIEDMLALVTNNSNKDDIFILTKHLNIAFYSQGKINSIIHKEIKNIVKKLVNQE